MKLDLTEPGDDKVISIEVARKRIPYIKGDACTHLSVKVDRLAANLTCQDCGTQVNPVEWIATMAEYWDYVKRLHARYREAKVQYEAKKRCRCDHCGKITNVRPATPAEVRAFKSPPFDIPHGPTK